jgi:hypothetical protein
MERLVERLAQRAVEIGRWLEMERSAPAEVRVLRQDDLAARAPEFDDSQLPLLAPGGDWREPLNTTIWLRFRLRRPAEWPVEDTALVAQRFGTYPLEPGFGIGRDLQRMQGMVYLGGKPFHGLDQYHRLIYLPAGPDYQFAASVWTGFADLEWQPNPVFRLVRIDPGTSQLGHDLRILADALKSLPQEDPARPRLEDVAERTLGLIDWSRPGGDAFRRSAAYAHEQVCSALAAWMCLRTSRR